MSSLSFDFKNISQWFFIKALYANKSNGFISPDPQSQSKDHYRYNAYYDILNVDKNALTEEIQKAYYTKSSQNQLKISELHESYEILNDAIKRK